MSINVGTLAVAGSPLFGLPWPFAASPVIPLEVIDMGQVDLFKCDKFANTSRCPVQLV